MSRVTFHHLGLILTVIKLIVIGLRKEHTISLSRHFLLVMSSNGTPPGKTFKKYVVLKYGTTSIILIVNNDLIRP